MTQPYNNFAESLVDVPRIDANGLNALIASLRADSESASAEAGLRLVKNAAKYGINVKDYLTLSVGRESDNKDALNGYERVLAALRLPVRNDFEHGITLHMASDTFQKFPGTRAMFPQVIDDMLAWQSRQNIFEDISYIVANSRTVAGTELLSTVVLDESTERGTFSVPELARIPVRTVRTTEQSVKFYKHGSAIRMSYEFNRRASLDILTPFANRVARELRQSKTQAAVDLIINGYSGNTIGYAAAPSVDQSDYDANTGATSANGKITWQNFLYWLVQRAKAGAPVDTIIGNWDSWFQWKMLTATNTANMGPSVLEILAAAGVKIDTSQPDPLSAANIKFALCSTAPANKLIGITKGETVEELIEAGSSVSESERSILNQAITMVKTENTGFKLVFGDTRSVYNYGA